VNASRKLVYEKIEISERFRIEIRVYAVRVSVRFPQGIKARFVLIDVERGLPRLVVDNHAPFGFHAHTRMPYESEYRELMEAHNHAEALSEFWRLALEVLKNEN